MRDGRPFTRNTSFGVARGKRIRDGLFRSLALKMLTVLHRVLLGRVYRSITMMRWGIDGVQLQVISFGNVQNVVLRAGGHDDRRSVSQAIFIAVYDAFSVSLFHAEKLVIVRVNFHPNVFFWAKGHLYKLGMFGCIGRFENCGSPNLPYRCRY